MSETLPALREDNHGVIPHAPPTSIAQVIIQSVRDPNMDPARLREFLAVAKDAEELQLRREERDSVREFNAAFAALKAELPSIAKTGVVMKKGGVGVQYRYARYGDLHKAVTPLLTTHGFSTSFDFEEPEANRLTCILKLRHSAGHEETYRWTLPAAGQNQYVSNLQNAAAARTFAKRCILIDALDILTEDADKDGADPAKITGAQAQDLGAMIAELTPEDYRAKTQAKILTVFGVAKLEDVPANCYRGAVMLLETARRGSK